MAIFIISIIINCAIAMRHRSHTIDKPLDERSVVFYDFASLAQYPRQTGQENHDFEVTMKSMHLLYADDGVATLRLESTQEWPLEVLSNVVRVWSTEQNQVVDLSISQLTANIRTGEKGQNKTGYRERGWCAAELSWISTSGAVQKFQDSKFHSGVMMTPLEFAAKTKSGELKFTFHGDMDSVQRLQQTVFDHAAQNVEKFLIDNLSPEEIIMTLKSLQHFQRLVCVRVQGSSDYKLDLAGAELLGETVRKTGCK